MNNNSSIFAFALLSISFLFASCNDSTNIGSNILEQDFIDSEFSDTLTIKALSLLGDTTVTYYPYNNINPHPGGFVFGNFHDPIFGVTNATIYTGILPSNNLEEYPPQVILEENIDSAFIELPYYYDGIYGSVENPMEISIYKLVNAIVDTSYNSIDVFDLGEEITTVTVTPTLNDTFNVVFPNGWNIFQDTIFDPIEDTIISTFTDSLLAFDTLGLSGYLRIPIPKAYAFELLTVNPASFNDIDLFKEEIPGIYMQSNTEDKGLLAFDMLYDRTGTEYFEPGIKIFCNTNNEPNDTIPSELYTFTFDGNAIPNPKVTNYAYDYSNSIVEDYINNPENNAEYFVVQGGKGIKTELEIPYVEDIADLAILKAELELTTYYFGEDNEDDYPPVTGLVLSREEIDENGDTSLIIIDDAFFGFSSQNLDGLFGGNPVEDDQTPGVYTYKMNIAAHLNKIRDGLFTKKMVLTVFTRPQRPGRVVICGPEHPDYPAKINLFYSN